MVGNDIACDILIRHFRRLGLCVDAKNNEGFTALLMAAKHGNITCAQILLGQGKASLYNRDNKVGLTVEQWLVKKGFTVKDIAPVRQDGKGRSRFVKLANIAAICTGPKKPLVQQPSYGDIDFALHNFHVHKLEDEEEHYTSDATTGTHVSLEMDRFTSRYNDIDMDFAPKHYRVPPYQKSRPKLKTQATQTTCDGYEDDDDNDDPDPEHAPRVLSRNETELTDIETESVIKLPPKNGDCNRPSKGSKQSFGIFHSGAKSDAAAKRCALPDIAQKALIARGDDGNAKSKQRKNSLDLLPEKIIASIDLGDGRRHSIQLHADSLRNKVYWTPATGNDSDEGELRPLEFDRHHVSDGELSTTDDGSIF